MSRIICAKSIIGTTLIFVLSVAIAKRPPYRKDYRYEKAFHAFYKLHHTGVSWYQARIRCEAEGTELVVPESLDEADALTMIISPELNRFEGVFVGIHDIYAEGTFVTINGDSFQNTFMELLWERSQPRYGGGRCVGMRRNSKLFVHDCAQRLPFVCKKKASDIVYYPECVTFDKRWVLGPNSTCYLTHTEHQTWRDAFDTCAGAGGHLVTLETKNEIDYIASLFNQIVQPITEDNFAFLGFNDLFQRFHYRTIFGDTLANHHANWDFKCPDSKDLKDVEQRCGGVSRTGLLTTSACEIPAVFFCEKPANDSTRVQIQSTTVNITTSQTQVSTTAAVTTKPEVTTKAVVTTKTAATTKAAVTTKPNINNTKSNALRDSNKLQAIETATVLRKDVTQAAGTGNVNKYNNETVMRNLNTTQVNTHNIDNFSQAVTVLQSVYKNQGIHALLDTDTSNNSLTEGTVAVDTSSTVDKILESVGRSSTIDTRAVRVHTLSKVDTNSANEDTSAKSYTNSTSDTQSTTDKNFVSVEPISKVDSNLVTRDKLSTLDLNSDNVDTSSTIYDTDSVSVGTVTVSTISVADTSTVEDSTVDPYLQIDTSKHYNYEDYYHRQ